LQPKREALVLICDEAHQLSESLLEELRILADFAESGRPLVRLVLVGQLSLEEKLAQPGLEAFNQRIRAHISLTTFDHAGSLDYIDYRITWSGGRTDEIFTPQALELIAHASDGVPRCINQLADHTLLLAFVAEQQPAGEELVREALSDLRQLPLHWNEPSQSLSSVDRSVHNIAETPSGLPALQGPLDRASANYPSGANSAAMMYSFEPETSADTHAIDVSSEASESVDGPVDSNLPTLVSHETFPVDNSTAAHRVEVGSDDWRQTLDLFHSPRPEPISNHEFADILAESAQADDDQPVKLPQRRHLDFHSLVEDTYNSASELPQSEFEEISVVRDPNRFRNANAENSSPTTLKDQSSKSVESSYSPVISTNRPLSQNGADDYQEEVIVDRYAAIDAGLEPPAAPMYDTPPLVEVRSESVISRTVSAPVEPAHALEVASELPRDRSAEKIAEEVYSLWESLRPNDLLNPPNASILNALRQQVESHDVNSNAFAVNSEPAPEASTVDVSATWDAIETPAPPPVVESRPFRYLFSSLRRKQRGLK
jgi:hypothetical protein